jgi:hypothetical protein
MEVQVMAYLHPLVFQGYAPGFIPVNSADIRKLYLDPVKSNLLVCLPAMDQSAYDVLRMLKPEAKQYLTNLLSQSTNLVVLFHGNTGANNRDEVTKFTAFADVNVELYCRYDGDAAVFKTIRATEIRSALLQGYRGLEKFDGNRCYYAHNGQWQALQDQLYTG